MPKQPKRTVKSAGTQYFGNTGKLLGFQEGKNFGNDQEVYSDFTEVNLTVNLPYFNP